jgi:hypothetical protein
MLARSHSDVGGPTYDQSPAGFFPGAGPPKLLFPLNPRIKKQHPGLRKIGIFWWKLVFWELGFLFH